MEFSLTLKYKLEIIMQKCTNCKRPIPDGALFCGHCGKTTSFEPNQAQRQPFEQYQVQAYDANGKPTSKKPAVKPNCDLSVAGFILSVFSPYLCVIAMILSAVALGKKQTRRGLAIAGLIISLVEILLIAAVYVLVFVFNVELTQYIPFWPQQ